MTTKKKQIINREFVRRLLREHNACPKRARAARALIRRKGSIRAAWTNMVRRASENRPTPTQDVDWTWHAATRSNTCPACDIDPTWGNMTPAAFRKRYSWKNLLENLKVE